MELLQGFRRKRHVRVIQPTLTPERQFRQSTGTALAIRPERTYTAKTTSFKYPCNPDRSHGDFKLYDTSTSTDSIPPYTPGPFAPDLTCSHFCRILEPYPHGMRRRGADARQREDPDIRISPKASDVYKDHTRRGEP